MSIGCPEVLSHDFDRALHGGSFAGLSEAELLGRFVARRDESAFEALISRHGPMVMGVCRRTLGDSHAAADAFQATFLVLVRRASSLRDADQLGPWLHGVAFRIATRARSDSARRRDRESRGARVELREEASSLDQVELRGILDEELNLLPERYRRPLILCYLEGHSHEEAARRLRCTSGMLRGRLDRGREKLRSQLGRRGVAPSVWLAAPTIASVPRTLVRETVLAAVRTPIGGAAGLLAVFRASSLVKFPLAASALIAVFLLALSRMTTRPEPRAARPPMQSPALAPDDVNLTGRVLDRAGLPIPGARVSLGGDRSSLARAVTDSDGRFAFSGVAPGAVVLTVQAADHAPDLKGLEAAPGMRPVEFTLAPGRSIGGRIIDLSGKPIAGAPITAGSWRGHSSLSWQTVTDLDGRYRWDHAPEDAVMIDLGTMGYTSKRLLSFPPGQNERELPMPRPRYVRGTVTDATTGKPIERFTVLTGHGDAAGNYLGWEYGRAEAGVGGDYEAKLGAEYRSYDRFVRIEAEGYLPERSRALGEAEIEWDRAVDFKLRRGDAAVAGVVRLPDGSPLIDADVTLVTSLAIIDNGRFVSNESGRRTARTGPGGQFRFPMPDSAYAIVVLNDRGYAERTSEEFARGSALTIQPWGRVEGTYRVGWQPGAGEKLALSRTFADNHRTLTQFTGYATVDAEGRFVFERVRDGDVVVARQVSHGDFGTQYPLTDLLKVAPGRSVRLAIGGQGRPVIGQLALSATVAEQADWAWSEILLVRADSPRRTFVGKHTGDGRFRIEDVPGGWYDVIVEVKKTPPDQQPAFSDEPLAAFRRRFQVPEMEGGRSDEPLDLGSLPPITRKE